MNACATPIPWERLVDYWAGDLDAASTDAIDEHLFGCESCTRASASIARIAQALRSQTPVVVTPATVRELKGRGLVIEENVYEPGTRREVFFSSESDVLVHHLGGLDLADVDRVHLTVKVESSGAVLNEDPFAPFDRERGEILVACQRHFAVFPPDVVFDVRTYRGREVRTSARYVLPHTFER